MAGQVAHLKEVYEALALRMKALPISHPGLRVETVGFRGCDDGHLGVLITPWCMHLVFVPPPETRREGAHTLGLPAGPVTLTWQVVDGFGALASRSLFSPMSQFVDQQMAVEVAEQMMATLLTAPAPAPPPPPRPAPAPRLEPSRRALFPFLRRRTS